MAAGAMVPCTGCIQRMHYDSIHHTDLGTLDGEDSSSCVASVVPGPSRTVGEQRCMDQARE